jgi:hypothetical protein
MVNNEENYEIIDCVKWSNYPTKIFALYEYNYPLRIEGILCMIDHDIDDDEIFRVAKSSIGYIVQEILGDGEFDHELEIAKRKILSEATLWLIDHVIDWYQIISWFRAFRSECPSSTMDSKLDL